ncbi:hypothetical protein CROQUDRAFT_109619 [Cronartium quercuum f. sp. fusiforme G11]|uniref:Intradiol ring-cleavage dioxygenases domain-containing protein n=1 Tax=Cronartium quercuum f. sp. fusiforme G11 TaxID=708437 RepID=A0A9P6T876_9BASI|nr:hypothetical protein CROQUDRAFT_109619 [Cronartium quercuum f. sp. fusiforme G11]
MSSSNMFSSTYVSDAMKEAEKNGFGNVDELLANLPRIKEQTVETITENTIAVNNQCPNLRMKFILERLVYHLHTFAKEVDLQTDEWMKGLMFLTETGQKCSDIRQEFILLSDILGLSALVNAQSNPKPPGCTESTVLGPFHTADAADIGHGESIGSEGAGTKLIVQGKVTDLKGDAIEGVKIDVWQTDEHGYYDVQYAERDGPDHRGIVRTDTKGTYKFEAVVPVAYPIPSDGTVAGLLKATKRHCFRPAHIHFKVDAKGFDPLVTAVYLSGDPFIASDAVFGVRNSLIVKLIEHPADQSYSKPYCTLEQNFVLPTLDEVAQLKAEILENKKSSAL